MCVLLCLQSLMCRAFFPWVLRSVIFRAEAFGAYCVSFEDQLDGQHCVVRTWKGNGLLEVCVNVESLGQRVPDAELSSLSRVVCSMSGSSLPISVHDIGQLLLLVLNEERSDGHQFVLARGFSSDVFLHCCRVAHKELFGMLEVTTKVDFLMLRFCGALQEPWIEDIPNLRRCVIAGKVSFLELCGVVAVLLGVWESIRKYVRYTRPCHVKTFFDEVIIWCHFSQVVHMFVSLSYQGGWL